MILIQTIQHFGDLRELPSKSITEGELFPPNPISFVQMCFGSDVQDYYQRISEGKSYYERLPPMSVTVADIGEKDCSFIEKYGNGHFAMEANNEVHFMLEHLNSEIELQNANSLLRTADLTKTSVFLGEKILEKYIVISDTLMERHLESLRLIATEVLEEILSTLPLSTQDDSVKTIVESVLSSSAEPGSNSPETRSISQLTGSGDSSFVTVWSGGSVTPADDVIIKNLLTEESKRVVAEAKSQILDLSKRENKTAAMREIVKKPSGREMRKKNKGKPGTKELDETKLFTDYASSPWQDAFNWFMGNFKSELQHELLYVPRTSKQFLSEFKEDSSHFGDSVIVVQNWFYEMEDCIVSLETGHQMTLLLMPDNSGPHILLSPEVGIYIVMAKPERGLSASLLSRHFAARLSCLRVWILCVGDFSLYMDSLIMTRHSSLKRKCWLELTALFVPDKETLISTIVKLKKMDGLVQHRTEQ